MLTFAFATAGRRHLLVACMLLTLFVTHALYAQSRTDSVIARDAQLVAEARVWATLLGSVNCGGAGSVAAWAPALCLWTPLG